MAAFHEHARCEYCDVSFLLALVCTCFFATLAWAWCVLQRTTAAVPLLLYCSLLPVSACTAQPVDVLSGHGALLHPIVLRPDLLKWLVAWRQVMPIGCWHAFVCLLALLVRVGISVIM
jgi:hypothetical protein